MSFYSLYMDPDIDNPVRLRKIKEYLNEWGCIHCSDIVLEDMWKTFSMKRYHVGYLRPEYDYVEEFAYWLDGLDDEDDKEDE